MSLHGLFESTTMFYHKCFIFPFPWYLCCIVCVLKFSNSRKQPEGRVDWTITVYLSHSRILFIRFGENTFREMKSSQPTCTCIQWQTHFPPLLNYLEPAIFNNVQTKLVQQAVKFQSCSLVTRRYLIITYSCLSQTTMKSAINVVNLQHVGLKNMLKMRRHYFSYYERADHGIKILLQKSRGAEATCKKWL